MTDKTEAMDNLIAQDADLIDVTPKVTEADREVLIRISNSDDETAQRIRRGLIYTWEVGEIARHRQYGYDQGYYDGCTRSVMQSEDCSKCNKFGDDCGEHSPSWEELAAYWKAEAERLRQPIQSDIFDACDVQKHTLIVDQDYASHTIKVKSLKDSQPTQSDVSFRKLAAVLYRKSADFQVGLTVEDSYTLAAEAIAFLQEQSK